VLFRKQTRSGYRFQPLNRPHSAAGVRPSHFDMVEAGFAGLRAAARLCLAPIYPEIGR
jgi:hypothetical protein